MECAKHVKEDEEVLEWIIYRSNLTKLLNTSCDFLEFFLQVSADSEDLELANRDVS